MNDQLLRKIWAASRPPSPKPLTPGAAGRPHAVPGLGLRADGPLAFGSGVLLPLWERSDLTGTLWGRSFIKGFCAWPLC